jgi:O-succinylbenzoic acid--CoA ligase
MPLGTQFVDRIVRAWDEGDAVFPLDDRLPDAARRSLLASVRPTVVCDGSGDTRLDGDAVDDGDAVVVATSGSSGQPKAAVLTHGAVRAGALAVMSRLRIGHGDTWLACLPPAHIGGLSVVLRSLVLGTPLLTAERFTVEAYEAAARNGATLVSLVPAVLARVDASLYRVIVLGGSRPPADRPTNCIATYGMTETGSGIVYDGRPVPGAEVEVRDGIVHVRGPMLMRGYRNGSAPFTPDGWLRTGDMGAINDDGTLSVHGREGDLIITGGENVWPETVEGAISSHPSVTDCCVVGVDDPEWGSTVHAFVVCGSPVTLEEIRDHVKQTLPAWCAPKALHVVGSVPRTALGKPRRAELAALAAGGAA